MLREQLDRRPTEALRKAVKGMLPRNRLGRVQITKLKIYAGCARRPAKRSSPPGDRLERMTGRRPV